MCIEVYHPEAELCIPFEHEVVIFNGPKEFESSFTFLVRNVDKKPIDRLYVLYPRCLFGIPELIDSAQREYNIPWLQRPEDITALMPDSSIFDPVKDESISFVQIDPNRPQHDREPLRGYWLPGEGGWVLPKGITTDHVTFLRGIEYTAWVKLLGRPLDPGQARWFWWKTSISGAGIGLGRTTLGKKTTIHRFASPVDVRRTLSEYCETGLRSARRRLEMAEALGKRLEIATWKQRVHHASTLPEVLGLRGERRVNLEYYELDIHVGDPRDQLLMSWVSERDLRMRSNSPHRPGHPESSDTLIYSWKSGSILEPDHSWKGAGFVLHMTLAHK
jgi:hypothetical protein